MAPELDISSLLDIIRNDAFMVRHYVRGGRTGIAVHRREQAILKLGLSCREAFNNSIEHSDFQAILEAIVEGLRPIERPAF